MPKSVIVIGASGTIGSAISNELEGDYNVIRAARSSGEPVDISDPKSIDKLFDRIQASHEMVDGIIVSAGGGMVDSIDAMDLDQFLPKLTTKLRGQIAVVKHGCRLVRPGGAIALTSGRLSRTPMHGMSHLTVINAGLEGFVRAAAIEAAPVRVCVVSPALVAESPPPVLELFDGMSMISAAELAKVYRHALEDGASGTTFDAFGT